MSDTFSSYNALENHKLCSNLIYQGKQVLKSLSVIILKRVDQLRH